MRSIAICPRLWKAGIEAIPEPGTDLASRCESFDSEALSAAAASVHPVASSVPLGATHSGITKPFP